MNSQKSTRVLLIGGMGFIGRHLTQACLEAGLAVRVSDISEPDERLGSQEVEYFRGDYREQDFLNTILDGVDMVVHMVHDTLQLNLECNMESEFERNIQPSIRLMDACTTHAVKKLLFVSSGGTVYGRDVRDGLIQEDACTRPISLYGSSKLMIEQIGYLYYIQKKLPFIVARPGNAYGPGQYPFRGQGLIATAMASALQDRTLSVFGDGSVVRDYIHVRDVAAALVALLYYGKVGETYNIGTGRGTTITALLEQYIRPLLAKYDNHLKIQYLPARGVDVPYNVLANTKLQQQTGFTWCIGLDGGLDDTWLWIKSVVRKGEK